MSVDIKSLILRQTESAGPIERAITNLKKVGEANLTKRRIQGRLEALRNNWKAFQEGHTRIIGIRDTTSDRTVRSYLDEHEYFKEGKIYLVEELFLEAQEYMATKLDVFVAEDPASGEAMAERSMVQQPGISPHGHRLPKIDLPKFDGNPRAAAQRVETVALNNENFISTWNYLSSVYDDKRLLVNTAMQDFVNATPVVKTSGTDLDRFNGDITRAITALESLGQYSHHCDAFVVYIVVSKLDANTVREWEESLGSTQLLPTWVKLLKFLEVRARSLQAFELARPRPSPNIPNNTSKNSRARQTTTAQTAPVHSATPTGSTTSSSNTSGSNSQTCSLCNAPHYIASCQAFRSKTPEQRKAVVTEKQLCFNCLGHHKVSSCRSQKRCQTCNGLHHTLIHSELPINPAQLNPTSTRTSPSNSAKGPIPPRRDQQRDADAGVSATVSHVISQPFARKNVLLTTALIRVQSQQGIEVQARALLDTGSELSFISESLAQLLKLSRQRVTIPLTGIGAQPSGSTRGAVTCSIRPHFNSNFSCHVYALTLPKLTAELPSLPGPSTAWTHLQGLQLADPNYAAAGRIDVILGADIYGQLLISGVKKGQRDAPVAQRTELGWVLSGPTSSASLTSSSVPAHGFQCCIDREVSDCDIQAELQRFWEQEEAKTSSSAVLSPEEEECEAHFLSTHSRDAAGRYIVHLPFKASPDLLGDSRVCAERMLLRMQKRFSSDTAFKELYTEFLRNYETLGHMRRAPDEALEPQRMFYLPHHGVLKDSTTTKLRVVFNGSAHSTSGHSLNNLLHTGAKLQTYLSDVILRWQRFQFAFAADIEKMFRQISVHPDDWDFQRVLWSPDINQPIQSYQLTTVTYGLGPAPFLACRVLRQLVEDEGHRFPLAVEIIRQHTYVDDTFGGADTLEEAQQTVQQLDDLCLAGGFLIFLINWKISHDSPFLDG